jgi:hypothetical protein
MRNLEPAPGHATHCPVSVRGGQTFTCTCEREDGRPKAL